MYPFVSLHILVSEAVPNELNKEKLQAAGCDVILPRDKERKHNSNYRNESRYFLSFNTHCSLFTSFKYFTVLNKKIVHFIFDSVVLPCHSCTTEKDLAFYIYRNVYHPSSTYKKEIV